MSWEATNLAAPELAKPSEPPKLCGLIYAGKRHVLSGLPEALKTLLALIFALELIRAGGLVAFVDFESGPAETRRLLEDLGATLDEVSSVFYFEPLRAPSGEDVAEIVRAGISLVVIDAAAGAYGVSGLDDNKRQDAEAFASTWIRGLWQQNIATIVVDHVVKSSEGRGRFAIGSERKLGQADVHLGLEAVKQLHRGATGVVKVATHKDRGGHLSRPYAAEIELVSDPKTHRITWQIRQPTAAASDNGWKPTVLMQRVSEYLAAHPDGASRNEIEKGIRGKSNEHKRQAIDELVNLGYAVENPGARGARVVSGIRRYTSPDLAPTSPGELTTTSPTSPAPTRGEAGGEVDSEVSEDDLARWESLLEFEPDDPDADSEPVDLDEATL